MLSVLVFSSFLSSVFGVMGRDANGRGVGAPLGVLDGYLYAHMVAPGECRALNVFVEDSR